MKQLTANCICIKVNGNNPQCQETKNAAIRYRINQEIKFLYTKKKIVRQFGYLQGSYQDARSTKHKIL